MPKIWRVNMIYFPFSAEENLDKSCERYRKKLHGSRSFIVFTLCLPIFLQTKLLLLFIWTWYTFHFQPKKTWIKRVKDTAKLHGFTLKTQLNWKPKQVWFFYKTDWLIRLRFETTIIPEQKSKSYNWENREENSTTLWQNFKVEVLLPIFEFKISS